MFYLLSVWVHVVSACAWVGGLLFFSLVLVPVIRKDPARMGAVVRDIGLRFRVVGWGSLGLLGVTGLTNVLARFSLADLGSAAFWSSSFGLTLAVKLALVAGIVVVTVVHDRIGPRASAARLSAPGSAEAESLRVLASVLGRLVALLALLVVLAAVLLVRGTP